MRPSPLESRPYPPTGMGKLDESIRAYDLHAKEFSRRYLSRDVSSLIDAFLKVAQVPQGGWLLDAGAGSGRDTIDFAARGFRIMAIDLSPEMIFQAKLAASEGKSLERAHVTRGNILRLPLRPGSFHAIWAMASLVHLSTDLLSLALSELVRVSKHGATLYLSVQKGKGWDTIENGPQARRHFHKHDPEELLTRIERLPVTVVRQWETTDTGKRSITWINMFLRTRSV